MVDSFSRIVRLGEGLAVSGVLSDAAMRRTIEALKEADVALVIGVPVGCFADPNFARPSKLFWASRRHHWLDLPADIAEIDTQ